MIRNNTITHPAFLNSLQSWHLPSQLFNAFLIALLTTILSYQLNAILSDLLLGLKPPFHTRAPTLHLKLLSTSTSLTEALAAVLRHDALERLRFRPHIPPTAALPRVTGRVPRRIVATLVVLLLAAPLCNLLSVVLASERDETVSFARARFGGLALGYIPPRSSVVNVQPVEVCTRRVVHSPIGAQSLVEFVRCPAIVAIRRMQLHNSKEVFVTMTSSLRAIVYIDIKGPPRPGGNHRFSVEIFSSMHYRSGDIYRLGLDLSVDSAKDLVARGLEFARRDCQDAENLPSVVLWSGAQFNVTQGALCPGFSEDTGRKMIAFMAASIALVEVEEFVIVNQKDLPKNRSVPVTFVSGRDLSFLTRRTKILSEGVLCILVASLLAFRAFVRFFTNNDAENALEAILKSYCKTSPFSSLLWDGSSIKYNCGYRIGENFQYGVERPEISDWQVLNDAEAAAADGKDKADSTSDSDSSFDRQN